MSEANPELAPPLTATREQLFPILTPEQIGRIAEHGRLRKVESGEVLSDVGQANLHFYVVTGGKLMLLRSGEHAETLALIEPGMFTGEVTMLTGRRGLAQLRADGPGEVIELNRDNLNRRRVERHPHAGLYLPPGRAHQARSRRCRFDGLELLFGDTSH
jgi:thioredoxin reductase (NADPH)